MLSKPCADVVPLLPVSTITTTGGTVGYTSTIPTIDANGAPTSVVIVDIPIPSGACLANVITCEATGLGVSFYANSVDPDQAYGNSSAISPDYYIVQSPLGTGSTSDLTVPRVSVPYDQGAQEIGTFPYYANVRDTYAGIDYDPNNGTFVFAGYFQPPVTGTYSFCVQVDTIDNFYLGADRAFPCGARQGIVPNAKATVQVSNADDMENGCTVQDLTKGFLYPIRSVYGMYALPSLLFTNITIPGDPGTTASSLNGLLYPQACGP